MSPTDPGPRPEILVARLLAWIPAARRDLPWRRVRTPYTVLVSEIMLQQTQVATVIPYFERWLARFPDLAALAAAPLDDVLKAWEGLGYYARARNLHAAARRVVAAYDGRLPDERAALLSLPGIGRYSAGAILSLAHGQAEPVLDGNVRRVLCRIYDIAEDPRLPVVEARLWDIAATLVRAAPPGEAGNLNESLMELGALICTPVRPNCAACPLREHCLALARGTQAARPVKAERPPLPHYAAVAAMIENEAGRMLLGRRRAKGLLGGLWEFPGERIGLPAGSEAAPAGLAAFLSTALLQKLGVAATPDPDGPTFQIRHAYTHFRITLHVFRAALQPGEPQAIGYAELAWVARSDLDSYALPTTDRKIAIVLTKNVI